MFAKKFLASLYPTQSETVADAALALADTQRWLRALSYAGAQALLADWGTLSPADVEKHLGDLWRMTHPGETPEASSRLFAHPFFWAPYIMIGERSERGTS